MEGGAQPRNSPAALPRRCPQTGHGLGDRKVGLGREPARGHTLKFVGHAPGPIGAAAPASAPGSPKRPVGRPVRRFSLRLSAALAGCGETKRCRGFLMSVVNLMTKAKCSKLTRNVLTDSNCGRKFYCGDVLGSPQNTLREAVRSQVTCCGRSDRTALGKPRSAAAVTGRRPGAAA